jgi:hypothetical protein
MIRIAELTGPVACAADVGIGFPPETSLRLCLRPAHTNRATVTSLSLASPSALPQAAASTTPTG